MGDGAMKIKRILLLGTALAFGLSLAYGQNWRSGSLEDALAKAKSTGKLLLLDFFQEYG